MPVGTLGANPSLPLSAMLEDGGPVHLSGTRKSWCDWRELLVKRPPRSYSLGRRLSLAQGKIAGNARGGESGDPDGLERSDRLAGWQQHRGH